MNSFKLPQKYKFYNCPQCHFEYNTQKIQIQRKAKKDHVRCICKAEYCKDHLIQEACNVKQFICPECNVKWSKEFVKTKFTEKWIDEHKMEHVYEFFNS